MFNWLHFVVGLAGAILKSRRNLLFENIALRHQLLVLSRKAKQPQWNPVDRVLWVWFSVVWSRWRNALRLVQPDTVRHWHRQGFRLFWRWKSRAGKAGRKSVAPATIALIRQMSRANPFWGAPRIHGELLKLGITVAQRTVSKYFVRQPRHFSPQTWTTFLRNHLGEMVSVDFLTVLTAQALGLEQLRIAPRPPWQSPYVERFFGSLRRECLDHVVVLNRTHLPRMLESYLAYYHGWRTHLGLDKDAP